MINSFASKSSALTLLDLSDMLYSLSDNNIMIELKSAWLWLAYWDYLALFVFNMKTMHKKWKSLCLIDLIWKIISRHKYIGTYHSMLGKPFTLRLGSWPSVSYLAVIKSRKVSSPYEQGQRLTLFQQWWDDSHMMLLSLDVPNYNSSVPLL